MNESVIWAGFILGLAGSAHCIGMCGPLVLALPANGSNKKNLIISRILYHVSRSVAYALMGFTLGFIGFGFALVGIQKYISILAGIIMLAFVLIPSRYRSGFLHASIIKMPTPLKSAMQKLMKSESPGSLTFLGFLNGFLPCGFVYMGLMGAVGMGSPTGSALFMFLFGLGTLPAMLLVSILPGFQSGKLKARLNALFPYVIVAIALLLILRGLGLGIPFLSPDLGSSGVHTMQH